MPAQVGVCRCGHTSDAHAHLRKGSDCALCGQGECMRFSPSAESRVSVLTRIRSRFLRRGAASVVLAHPRYRDRGGDRTSPADAGGNTEAKEA